MTRSKLNAYEAEITALRQRARLLRADADAVDAVALRLSNWLSQCRFTQLEEEGSILSANNWPAIMENLQQHVKLQQ